jgi:DNA-binding MarR family transcriptional regulator
VADPRWLDDDEARAWNGLMQMTELLRGQLSRELQQVSGMSDADYAVLLHLSADPERRIRMTDLATRMMWSKSRLSHQIGRMEARGLVRKEECPSDARGAFAALTPAGLAEIQAAIPEHIGSVRRNFIGLLDREQLRQLASISEKVLEYLTSLGASAELCQAAEVPCPALAVDSSPVADLPEVPAQR